jgi:uncharacterized protein DUF5999
MCGHRPQCPPADASDHGAARVVAAHPEQGWSLLCNGVVVFDDTGELFPDGHSSPRRDRALVTAGSGCLSRGQDAPCSGRSRTTRPRPSYPVRPAAALSNG